VLRIPFYFCCSYIKIQKTFLAQDHSESMLLVGLTHGILCLRDGSPHLVRSMNQLNAQAALGSSDSLPNFCAIFLMHFHCLYAFVVLLPTCLYPVLFFIPSCISVLPPEVIFVYLY
jgi:hypothetical protein